MKINYGGTSDAIMTTGASYHDGEWHHIVFVLETTCHNQRSMSMGLMTPEL